MTETERLLVEVMERMARHFEAGAVLRGGMALRVLGCERFTNDVDYLLIPYRSKNDALPELLKALGNWEGVELTHSMNSKCLRVRLKRAGVVAQVEVKVGMEAPTRALSTRELYEPLGMSPRLIPVLDFPVALADKLAAWNERRLMRDLYDIWFFLRLGIRPDEGRLRERLLKPVYSRLVREKDRLKDNTPEALIQGLRETMVGITDQRMAEELRDSLPAMEIVGLADKIRTEIIRAFG